MFTCSFRGLRRLTALNTSVQRHLAASYKSEVSLERLYPNSDQNFLKKHEIRHSSSGDSDESFTGYIPIGELDIKCVKSGGPGGQNVNNVKTKVEMKFNVDDAIWIPEWIKPQLKEQQRTRLTKNGDIVITSEKTRTQALNKADCLEKIRHMIFTAAIKPQEPTEEELQLIAERKAKAKRQAIQQKRRRSDIKRGRQHFE